MTSTIASKHEADDATLLAGWRDRAEEAAFEVLCVRHSHLVASAARRRLSPDPEEAAQAVFMVLAQRPGAVGQPSQLTGWLLGTTRKVVANQRRIAANRHHHEQESALENARQNHAAPSAPAWDDVRPLLDDALLELSPLRREAVVRFYLEGSSQRQIAEDLQCSIDAVKNRIQEGLAKLRSSLSRRGMALGVDALVSGLAGEAATHDVHLSSVCSAAAKGTNFTTRMAQITAHTGALAAGKGIVLLAAAVLLGTTLAVAMSLGRGSSGPSPGPHLVSASSALGSVPFDPPAVRPTWIQAAATLEEYVGPMTLLLPTGRVLVLNGDDNSVFNSGGADRLPSHAISPGGFVFAGRNNPELFDPARNTWVAAKPMIEVRQSNTCTMTLLPDGTVLVAGGNILTGEGFGQRATPFSHAEIYDPRSDTWHSTAPLLASRSGHSAVVLPTGLVLVAGGRSTGNTDDTSCELYDPKFKTWTPTAAMHALHEDTLSLVVLKNGLVLACGGDVCELYDPKLGTWTTTGAMLTPRFTQNVILLPNGKVLVVGGRTATSRLATCELYDPSSGIWSRTGELSSMRSFAGIGLLRSGRVLATGGCLEPVLLNVDGESQALDSCETYDLLSGQWSPAPSLLMKRCCHSLTVLPTGGVLVVGGITNVNALNLEGITSCERLEGFAQGQTPSGPANK